MFEIILENTGKRFNKEWIFKDLHYVFKSNNFYAIEGANGSGKSTLLQIIAGSMLASNGNVKYKTNSTEIASEKVYHHVAIAAPYIEVIEEMTANEFLHFHHSFKQLVLPVPEILQIIALEKAANKQIRYFSSGMKQRVKLGQAIFADTPALFLDEPCSNLDEKGIALYHQLIQTHTSDRLVVVASNDPIEYSFCHQT
ncbi:MAG TPA: ATP-binding cassette domain-containing protein, partial [Chitinophagaceae bacterium]|nr:ATP-binding cassette domain-containing protein [Chitinophagaceae bacterium]